jgi:hypothetical protein
MVTLVSHDGTCCVGVNADARAIPDTTQFVDCLRSGFDEVLALADIRSIARAPIAVASKARAR